MDSHRGLSVMPAELETLVQELSLVGYKMGWLLGMILAVQN